MLNMAIVALLALGAGAGSADIVSIHGYIVEQDTPVGTVCLVNLEQVLDGLQDVEPEVIAEGVVLVQADGEPCPEDIHH